jgi:tripartite-type tricarboxylate transporter receptor subunit TctC
MSRKSLLPALTLVAVLPAIAPAAAQSWPVRPLTLVAPFAAGGTIDAVARILAVALSQTLGQQVVVENIGGAGGMTGANRVAKAAPDGYQLVLGSTGNFAQNQILYKAPPYNAVTDFAPVALITEQAAVLITRKDLPATDLKEFIAHTKANHTKMQYGSSGAGSAPHLACVLLNAAIGVQVTHVPYRGGGPAMQDLIAGRIDYQCPISTAAIPQIEGGAVKAIAVLARNRSSTTPTLPTAHEQGLENVESPYWTAAFLPGGTSPSIIQTLNSAIVTVMSNPSVQTQMRKIGAELVAPERRSPQYLQEFVKSEIKRWEGPIKASGVTMD